MARQTTRLYLITLRASTRKVGTAVLHRGDSFTLPLTADVRDYKRWPRVWDVKVIQGAPSKPEPAPAPGSKARPVTGKASAAFTGLVNRLEAAGQTAERLGDGEDLAGYRAMLEDNADTVAAYLRQALGGSRVIWLAMVQDPDGVAKALDGVLEPAAELADELEATRGELDQAAASLEGATAEIERLRALLAERTGEAAALEAELAARADAPPSSPRGEDADDADADAKAEAGPTTTTPKGEPPSSSGPEGSPAVTDLEAFQAGLVALQSGDEAMTMSKALDLAQAAGLEVPPSLRRIRRRDELATELATLLAAHQAPPSKAGKSASPSPASLED